MAKFVTHLAQEGSKAGSTANVDLRLENIMFIKTLCK